MTDRFIISQNIARYRRMIACVQDENQLKTLSELLDEEVKKLAAELGRDDAGNRRKMC